MLAAVAVGAVGAATVLSTGQDAEGTAARPGPAGQLQRDADAVRDTGATGLLARVRDADGRDTTVRAGVADLEGRDPVPENSYYRIGSDTKTFVAVVALQLTAEGKLHLDDTVEEWLPGMVTGNGNDGSRITLRNLLQHTSGLVDYTEVLFEDPETLTSEGFRERRFVAHTLEEEVALATSRPPNWLPDAEDPESETRWSYSNTNYVLAGLIIEQATGHPWQQEVHDRIIEPLGLRHTITLGTSAYVPQPTATAYTRFPGEEEFTDTSLAVDGGPDGGIVSTTADMNTFWRALMDGTLLPAEQLAQMRTTVPAPGMGGGAEARYGLGIAWRPAEGCAEGVWYHSGTSFGTVSQEAVTPDGGTSATVTVFTTQYDDEERFRQQEAATLALLDHAVCGSADRAR